MTSTSLKPARPSVPALIELLTRQRDLYKQLDRLSDEQMRHVEQGATEQLLTVLSQRQAVIDALSRLSVELTPYRDDWSAMSGRLSSEDRLAVRELMDDVDRSLHAVLDRDEQAKAKLQAAQDHIGTELRQVTGASVAVNAYRSNQRQAPRFADRKG